MAEKACLLFGVRNEDRVPFATWRSRPKQGGNTTTSCRDQKVAGIMPPTAHCYTLNVTTEFMPAHSPLRNRVLIGGRSQRLEPDAGKLASPVLRGGNGSNAVSLPDPANITRPGRGPL